VSAQTSSLLDEISRIARQPVLDEELTEKLPNYLQVLGQNFKVPLDESKFKSPVFSKDKEEYPSYILSENVTSTPRDNVNLISANSEIFSESYTKTLSESSESVLNYGERLTVEEEIKTKQSSQVISSETSFSSGGSFDLDF